MAVSLLLPGSLLLTSLLLLGPVMIATGQSTDLNWAGFYFSKRIWTVKQCMIESACPTACRNDAAHNPSGNDLVQFNLFIEGCDRYATTACGTLMSTCSCSNNFYDPPEVVKAGCEHKGGYGASIYSAEENAMVKTAKDLFLHSTAAPYLAARRVNPAPTSWKLDWGYASPSRSSSDLYNAVSGSSGPGTCLQSSGYCNWETASSVHGWGQSVSATCSRGQYVGIHMLANGQWGVPSNAYASAWTVVSSSGSDVWQQQPRYLDSYMCEFPNAVNEEDSRHYTLIHQPGTGIADQAAAAAICQARGLYLASIESVDEYKAALAAFKDTPEPAFPGLGSATITQTWMDGYYNPSASGGAGWQWRYAHPSRKDRVFFRESGEQCLVQLCNWRFANPEDRDPVLRTGGLGESYLNSDREVSLVWAPRSLWAVVNSTLVDQGLRDTGLEMSVKDLSNSGSPIHRVLCEQIGTPTTAELNPPPPIPPVPTPAPPTTQPPSSSPEPPTPVPTSVPSATATATTSVTPIPPHPPVSTPASPIPQPTSSSPEPPTSVSNPVPSATATTSVTPVPSLPAATTALAVSPTNLISAQSSASSSSLPNIPSSMTTSFSGTPSVASDLSASQLSNLEAGAAVAETVVVGSGTGGNTALMISILLLCLLLLLILIAVAVYCWYRHRKGVGHDEKGVVKDTKENISGTTPDCEAVQANELKEHADAVVSLSTAQTSSTLNTLPASADEATFGTFTYTGIKSIRLQDPGATTELNDNQSDGSSHHHHQQQQQQIRDLEDDTIMDHEHVSLKGSALSSSAIIAGGSLSQSEKDWRPLIKNFKEGKVIGTGAFGKVIMGFDSTSGSFLAAKELDLSPPGEESDQQPNSNSKLRRERERMIQSLSNEVQLMKRLKHQHIVRYLGVDSAPEKKKFYIFMDYMPGGSVRSVVSNFGALNPDVAAKYLKEALLGLVYLHGEKVMHRDIKGANMLLDQFGQLKLADFGCSQSVDDENSLKGTPSWLAPEVLLKGSSSQQQGSDSGGEVGAPSDIWSIGCTAIELLSGESPFCWVGNGFAVMQTVAAGGGKLQFALDTLPPEVTADSNAHDFVKQCCRHNPGARPTALELLEHPWIKSASGSKGPGHSLNQSLEEDHKLPGSPSSSL